MMSIEGTGPSLISVISLRPRCYGDLCPYPEQLTISPTSCSPTCSRAFPFLTVRDEMAPKNLSVTRRSNPLSSELKSCARPRPIHLARLSTQMLQSLHITYPWLSRTPTKPSPRHQTRLHTHQISTTMDSPTRTRTRRRSNTSAHPPTTATDSSLATTTNSLRITPSAPPPNIPPNNPQPTTAPPDSPATTTATTTATTAAIRAGISPGGHIPGSTPSLIHHYRSIPMHNPARGVFPISLTSWQQYPPPPLSNYDTPNYPFWNPAQSKPREEAPSLGPELERSVGERERQTGQFGTEQYRMREEILAMEERIRGKQQALEQVRRNRMELRFDRTRDNQGVAVEMEHLVFVERELLGELEVLGREREGMVRRGREVVEGWLRGEDKRYKGY
ncbi:hypothetical protein QC761_304545 [Podospora bellae-mahoneyi]|uniref:Uncharacterized protein n=1 Tax=Podospora bellae-mahoneyi TaxID=2093777 RepID=A0ABR0FN01_9PEZI|nr:hypothetical protein QC761_304545 [Podospora bellae-mahoneyi]